jgi:hypothetical protein
LLLDLFSGRTGILFGMGLRGGFLFLDHLLCFQDFVFKILKTEKIV